MPVAVHITEDDSEPPTPKATPISTTPAFIIHVRDRLQKMLLAGPHWARIRMPIRTTTVNGVFVDWVEFQRSFDGLVPWGVTFYETNTHIWAETLERAWIKALEEFNTKTRCLDCDSILRVGDPCVSCCIREMIATKECIICKENKHNFYQLCCGHSFCKDCIKKIKRCKCPLCRARFKLNDGLVEQEESSDDDEEHMDDEN